MLGLDGPKPSVPWAIVRNGELQHIGLYPSEEDLWIVFTGWGDKEDIQYYIKNGYQAYQLKVYLNENAAYKRHYRTRPATNRVRT